MVSTEKVPLYQKIFEELHQRIKKGQYTTGGKLDSENDLCHEFSTSRQTIRMAMDMLIARGLVERVPGKGSYVVDQNGAAEERPTANIVIVCPPHHTSNDAQVLCDAKVLNGIRSIFSENSKLTLEAYSPDEVRVGEFQTRYSSRECDGLVLLSPPIKQQKLFARVAVPTLVIGHVIPEAPFSNICTNMFKMGYDSAQLLLDHGHEQFGYFSGNLENFGVKRFIAGVENALLDRRRNWDPALRFSINSMEDCRLGLDQLLAAEATCVLLDGDVFADAVYHDLLRRGRNVPQDMSLIITEMHHGLVELPPHYTGFSVDHFDLGVRGARILQQLMESDDADTPINRVINLPLVSGRTLASL